MGINGCSVFEQIVVVHLLFPQKIPLLVLGEYTQYPPQEHPTLRGLAMTHFVTPHMPRPMIA